MAVSWLGFPTGCFAPGLTVLFSTIIARLLYFTALGGKIQATRFAGGRWLAIQICLLHDSTQLMYGPDILLSLPVYLICLIKSQLKCTRVALGCYRKKKNQILAGAFKKPRITIWIPKMRWPGQKSLPKRALRGLRAVMTGSTRWGFIVYVK